METLSLRVLYLDPDPNAVRLLSETLHLAQSVHIELHEAGSLAEALEKLRLIPFDALLTELDLPDADPLEGLRALAAEYREGPVIVFSHLSSEELSLQSLQEGAQDYLVKEMTHLRLMVRSLRYSIERHRIQSLLRHLALVDEHNGLYNRRGLLTLGLQSLHLARRGGRAVHLVTARLAELEMKPAEAGSGPGMEEPALLDARRREALVQASWIFKKNFRLSDIVAHLGNGIFAALALDIAVEDGALDGGEVICERLARRCEEFNRHSLRPFLLRFDTRRQSVPLDHDLGLADLLDRSLAQLTEGR